MCAALYTQAATALAQKEPEKALSLMVQIDIINPDFPDAQQVRPSAEAAIQKQGSAKKRNGILAFLLIGLLIVIGIVVINGGFFNRETAVNPAPTETSLPIAIVVDPTETKTPQPTNTAVALPTQTATPQTTTTATATATPTTTRAATTAATTDPYMTIIMENANIYPAPNSNTEPIAVLETGATVWVNGRSEEGSWLYIKDELGNEGFISRSFVNWEGDFEGLTIKEPQSQSINPTQE
jgi:hypothetical protein